MYRNFQITCPKNGRFVAKLSIERHTYQTTNTRFTFFENTRYSVHNMDGIMMRPSDEDSELIALWAAVLLANMLAAME